LVQDRGGAELSRVAGFPLSLWVANRRSARGGSKDLKRGNNKDIGPKDIFEMGSNFICEDSRLIFFLKYNLFVSKINLGRREAKTFSGSFSDDGIDSLRVAKIAAAKPGLQICNQRQHVINFYIASKQYFFAVKPFITIHDGERIDEISQNLYHPYLFGVFSKRRGRILQICG
jgi:hypothetical protein